MEKDKILEIKKPQGRLSGGEMLENLRKLRENFINKRQVNQLNNQKENLKMEINTMSFTKTEDQQKTNSECEEGDSNKRNFNFSI